MRPALIINCRAFLLFLLKSFALTSTTAAAEHHVAAHSTRNQAHLEMNLRYHCRGALGEHSACLCNDKGRHNGPEVSCINAQFVDTSALMYVNGYYDSATSLTFHGNNFQELPNSPLFGFIFQSPRAYLELKVLNLSANYIVNLNSEALSGVPNIEVLDLSNNEIVLNWDNENFLTHTPLLTHLYLRRALASPTNRTVQFEIMMRIFKKAKLQNLKMLDLSYNYIHFVPYNLPCPFPSLSKLDLRQNLLKTVAMNTTCLRQIELIDLSSSYIHDLDAKFRKEFAEKLPPQSLNIRNSFYCDCKSSEWIRWLKNTNIVVDKSSLVCGKASPQKFIGVRILEVPSEELDCKTDLYTASRSASSNLQSKYCEYKLSLLLFVLIYTLRVVF